VDPIADLRPVCPNCHAVIHRANPPYTLDDVRDMLR
jgi:predicted HNH restriction endonuclease